METPTNEQLCAKAQSGDKQAENDLVEQNLLFIRETAYGIYTKCEALCDAYAIEADDLIQEGCIGLFKAIRRYNTKKGALFLTYAALFIRNGMWDLIRKYRRLYEQKIQDKDNLGLTKTNFSAFSEEEHSRQLYIGEFHQNTPEQDYVTVYLREELMTAFHGITERERAYLRYRYGFEDSVHTLTETAEHFHLRRESAKQLEERALEKLRQTVTR